MKKLHQQPIDEQEELEEEDEEELMDEHGMGVDADNLHMTSNGYLSDEDALNLDDNKIKNQLQQQNSGKKRHLTTQESISDSEFFSQRFDGPGLKNLSKQESIIQEEDESGYSLPETKAPLSRVPSMREVNNVVFLYNN